MNKIEIRFDKTEYLRLVRPGLALVVFLFLGVWAYFYNVPIIRTNLGIMIMITGMCYLAAHVYYLKLTGKLFKGDLE